MAGGRPAPLDSADGGSLPAEQKEVTVTEGTAIRQDNPVQSFLETVPGTYASKTNGPAMRTMCREHSDSYD